MSEGDLSSRVPFLRAASVPGAAREAAEFEAARPTDLSAGRFGGLSQLEGLAINPESTGAVMLATASLGRGLTSRSAVRSVSPAFRETAPAPEAYEAARPTRRVREPRPAPAAREAEVRFERVIDIPNFLPSWFLGVGASRARAVCKIETSGIDYEGMEGSWSGTGVLISENILLTNHHVLNSKQVGEVAVCIFNYENDESGRLLETKTYRCNPDRLFLTSPATGGGLDFTFVWVEGGPGREFGYFPIYRHAFTIANDACANIIQHPAGRPKSVVVQQNEVRGQDSVVLHYKSDTEFGSSGALVANNSWRPVALHHASRKVKEASGSSPAEYVNEGIKFAAIATYLESLAPGSPSRTAANEVLGLFRATDAVLGFFGALGRDSEGAASDFERVVNSYEGEGRDIDVGFWNIEWFNRYYRDKLDSVAQVVLQMNLDVWAFEESSPEATEALVGHLSNKYHADFAYLASEPNAPTSRQTTTVIWNRKTVHCERVEWPEEIDRWFRTHSNDFDDIDFEAEQGRIFDRYPGLFRVRSTQTESFDFLLVPLHLKAKSEGSLRRRMASKILARAVQKMIERGEDGDWVLGGDYNATLASGDFDQLSDGDLVAVSA
ncbi:MAG TPA: trypsin-like peptidase domain-containing protein, partial [Thermoanaerobaculia bacterium]|nr:trypsin-like peptidase domain-containing protein [Thermoanaerobaculia bacterium]